MKLFAATSIFLLAALSTIPQMRGAPPIALSKVVVALKPDKDPDAMVAERAELSKHLSKTLGKPVDVIVPFPPP
jgi:ABC-type phosphate/phosphonate transport system substrate-binding protein